VSLADSPTFSASIFTKSRSEVPLNTIDRRYSPTAGSQPRLVPPGSGGVKVGSYFVPENVSCIPRVYYTFVITIMTDRRISLSILRGVSNYVRPQR
jgi:hypothetical protein